MRRKTLKQAGLFKIFLGILISFVGIFLLIRPVTAQENEISQLRQKVSELEKKVEKLEAQLKEQESLSKTLTDPENGWQNKKNWRLLKLGFTESQVRNILGQPTKTIKGIRTLWYYPNIYCGYVSFDENGRLTGWSEP